MKKSIRKVLSLVLALAFVFSLAACSPQPAADSADVGLRVFSSGLDGAEPWVEKVPTGPLSDQVGGQSRRQGLDGALAGLRPAAATHTYPSLQDAYGDAVAHYTAGRPNSVPVAISVLSSSCQGCASMQCAW